MASSISILKNEDDFDITLEKTTSLSEILNEFESEEILKKLPQSDILEYTKENFTFSEINDDCDKDDLLNALCPEQAMGVVRGEYQSMATAQTLATLSDETLRSTIYYLSDETAQKIAEALKFYQKG